MRSRIASWLQVASLTAIVGAGCSFGESGVAPPLDRLFLPTGLAVDPSGRWLYVVNSNFDLRYNAGTVVAVDLDAATADRQRTDWAACPTPQYAPTANSPPHSCCRDFFEPEIVNCDERGYIVARTTPRIGSFGGTMQVEPIGDVAAGARRLY